MTRYVLGVDLGGTNLRAGVVRMDGDAPVVVNRFEAPTDAAEGPMAVLDRLAGALADLVRTTGLASGEILGCGVGAPGPLDGAAGIIHDAPNMPGWKNIPLAQILGERTGYRVVLENDANAAAWGEFTAGAGRGCRHMVLMTLGTGVGGAVILNGELWRGPDWTAGEVGHVVIQDGGRAGLAGSAGALEAYASAPATVERFREQLAFGWKSALSGLPPQELTCERIFRAAAEGDNLARHVVGETGRYLGVMAANLANLLNPERCIFAGGMIRAGDLLFDAIRDECAARAFPAPAARMTILPAALGPDAGLIGAAGCALTAFETSP